MDFCNIAQMYHFPASNTGKSGASRHCAGLMGRASSSVIATGSCDLTGAVNAAAAKMAKTAIKQAKKRLTVGPLSNVFSSARLL